MGASGRARAKGFVHGTITENIARRHTFGPKPIRPL
jgi:hypothetical protein